jgi:hypothetical protein
MMAFLLLTIINGCQKDEPIQLDDQPQNVVKNPMFLGLDTIAFSVEDNRLVFETEEDFQKCIDFLLKLKEENYDDFENEIGFTSLRRTFNNSGKNCPIEDDIFSTLLNDDMQIIVEHYLFSIDVSTKNVLAHFIGENNDLKSFSLEQKNARIFSFNDDVFALLKQENSLKSIQADFCGQEKVEYSYPDFIKAKVDYNKYGIFISLVAKIWNDLGSQYYLYYLRQKTVDSPYNPPSVPNDIISRCFYINKKDQDVIIYDQQVYNNDELKITPYSGSRRLKGFRLDVEFWWKFNSWDNMSYDNLMIECHQY